VLEPNSPDIFLQLDEGPMGEPEGTFVDYQTTMVKTAKAIAVTVQEMVGTPVFPTPGGASYCSHIYPCLRQEADSGAVVSPRQGNCHCCLPALLQGLSEFALLPLVGHQIHHQPR